MPRYIDSDALKEQIESHVCTVSVCGTVDEARAKMSMRNQVLKDIDNAPTADAVPVVRCSDCIYWQPPTYQEQEDGSTVGHCTAACKGQTDMNWFCADGTR